jgi:hypothetical protein
MELMATKITIVDLFPDDEGMILVAEDAGDGSLRHISEVPNGAACGCICFGCKRRLTAKNGGDPARMAHHFAHRAEDIVIDCTSAGETALHSLPPGNRLSNAVVMTFRAIFSSR